MKQILFTILCFWSLGIQAQDSEVMTIPYLEVTAKIDGVLDDQVWENLSVISGFYNQFPNDEGLADNQTELKIFHNKKFLYIGVLYRDAEERNNIASLKRDIYDDIISISDCFGIVLDPYNEGNNGYLFGVNASGVQYDALMGNINQLNSSWSTVWYSEVSKNGKNKYYEIAIPLNAINFKAEKNIWGIQFFTNDTKQVQFSTLAQSPRNFAQYDLRFTKKFRLENLPEKVTQKFSLLPSVSINYAEDKIAETSNRQFIPSLDGQYAITPSLRLDATINPDFSQVEVDQQVTNLSRFAINFPERRKFFLENSDLFNNLGSYFGNPFNSRRIGSETDILFGGKVSGNIGTKTRIGLLNVQTKETEEIKGKNYSVLVGQQNLSNLFNATIFMINTQQGKLYNRIGGGGFNYKSKNNVWSGEVKASQAFTNETNKKNGNYFAEVFYQKRKWNASAFVNKIEKNYIAETGFIPFLYNYDASTGTTIRESYTRTGGDVQLKHFPENSKHIDWIRRFWLENRTTLDANNQLKDYFLFLSPFAIRFKNRSYVYAVVMNQYDNLQYNFDVLQNGNYIQPGEYNFTYGRTGYWSPNNRKFYFATKFEFGQFYNGFRINPFGRISYRMLPRAVFSIIYEMNDINLGELGRKSFHLAKFSSEVYLNNRMNWTTYLQYNTQQNNFNINSRFQWEYKPLSYIYFVFSNNFDNNLNPKDWGVSFKINRRFDF